MKETVSGCFSEHSVFYATERAVVGLL